MIGENTPMKRKRPKRRRKCIGRKQKRSVGGGNHTRKSANVGKYADAVSPALRPRTMPSHRAITQDTVVDSKHARIVALKRGASQLCVQLL